jgi:hypothetical protein
MRAGPATDCITRLHHRRDHDCHFRAADIEQDEVRHRGMVYDIGIFDCRKASRGMLISGGGQEKGPPRALRWPKIGLGFIKHREPLSSRLPIPPKLAFLLWLRAPNAPGAPQHKRGPLSLPQRPLLFLGSRASPRVICVTVASVDRRYRILSVRNPLRRRDSGGREHKFW